MDYTYTICILQRSHCSASSDQGKGVVHTLCVIGLSAGLQYTLYVVCVVTLGECTRVSSVQWQLVPWKVLGSETGQALPRVF